MRRDEFDYEVGHTVNVLMMWAIWGIFGGIIISLIYVATL